MKNFIIEQKQTNSGSIHDLASEHFDRVIKFKSGCKYAVVLSSYYGDSYTIHKSAKAAANRSNSLHKRDFSHSVIDLNGIVYDVDFDQLRKTSDQIQ